MKLEIDFSRTDAAEGILPDAFAKALSKHFKHVSVGLGKQNKTSLNFSFFAEDDWFGIFGRTEARIINHTIGVSPDDVVNKRYFVDVEVNDGVYGSFSSGFKYGLCCVFFPALIWYKSAEKKAERKLKAKLSLVLEDVRSQLAEGKQPSYDGPKLPDDGRFPIRFP